MSYDLTAPGAVSMTAVGHFREALEAMQHGDRVGAASALMAIDPQSWHGIETRLAILGTTLPAFLAELAPRGADETGQQA
ncbi:hypothetical protein DVA86_27960 [Streptomyces armeniacus]|uniref:Uncharacterized protein n=1 Tax=Streptomyces armeniacus TaxID=83291 RepID=A0A345XW74_9ACTN|nr:hypothetical protein [Streptomyces armeniacus]AXK35890.1 hypothetical protein DVA86_27960 [Streptomyces armeniacus]